MCINVYICVCVERERERERKAHMLSIMVFVEGNGIALWVQILNEAVWVLLSTNALVKDINPSVYPNECE